LVNELIRYFNERISLAQSKNIRDIIIDPGFGFGKDLDQNFEMLQKLDYFRILEKPLLVGISRKSMIYKTLETTPDNALAGTIAANTVALLNGASILRVHDVKEAMDAIQIIHSINKK
jgi:dihydropteroate synthase